MSPYLLDLAEFAALILIGVVLMAERSRLNDYFAGRVGGGAGSDAYMLFVALAIFVGAVALAFDRTRAWQVSRSAKGRREGMDWAGLRRPALALGCVVIYAATIPLLGYFLSSLLFFAAYSRLDSRRVATNVAFGILMAGGFYLVFQLLLGTAFPKGALTPW